MFTNRKLAVGVLILAMLIFVSQSFATPDAEKVKAMYKVSKFAIADISVPEDLPETFTTVVDIDGKPVTLIMTKRSVRGPNTEILIQIEGGEFVEADPGPVTTYSGYVRGNPTTIVTASLRPNGLKAKIMPKKGNGWTINPAQETDPAATKGKHVVTSQADSTSTDFHGDNETIELEDGTTISPSTCGMNLPEALAKSAQAVDCLEQAEYGIDLEYYYYTWMGSNTASCIAAVEQTIIDMNGIFNRCLGIDFVQGRTIIRTSSKDCPYYRDRNALAMLVSLAEEWEENQSDSNHDLATVCNGNRYGAGWAYVGQLCNIGYSSVFPWPDGVFTEIAKHEVGHTFCGYDMHDNCLQDFTIMCGNGHWYFADETQEDIMAYIGNVNCLTTVEGAGSNVQPFAALDRATVDRTTSNAVIDVLDNDLDGDCDTLTIDSYESTSMLGATVGTSSGNLTYDATGAVIVYGAGSDTDVIHYVADDGTVTDEGWGTITITNEKAQCHYKLEETTGTSAYDSSGNLLTATISGADYEASGQYGACRYINDATSDYISMPPLNMTTDTATMTCWVKRNRYELYGFYQ